MKGGEAMAKLTEKQKRFVDYYIETGNATEAAKRAGYSEKTARFTGAENLTKTNIKTAIAARLAELDAQRIADAEEVMQFFTSVMRGEIKEEVVTTEGTDEGCSTTKIVEKQVSLHDRLDAGKQLSRRYGLDKLVIEQKSDDRVQIIMPPKGDQDDAGQA